MYSQSPATFLSIPVELRTKIYNLALHDNPTIIPSSPYRIPNLSLLSTNRQIYHESRSIPLTIYPYGNEYKPSKPFFKILQPFQIASLRKLSIFYLYPGDLKEFASPLKEGNGFLFNEPTLNLDILTIYADDWLTYTNADGRHNVASPEDLQYELPRSNRWLCTLCELSGWRQLELSFSEREYQDYYPEEAEFIAPLFEGFRATMRDTGLGGAFTIWHKEDMEAVGETVTVFRTKDLHLHSSPQWEKKDLARLVEGKECAVVGDDDDDDAGCRYHVDEWRHRMTVDGWEVVCPSCAKSRGDND